MNSVLDKMVAYSLSLVTAKLFPSMLYIREFTYFMVENWEIVDFVQSHAGV